MASVHLTHVASGVLIAAMARVDWEVRERLAAEEADEAYMIDLRRQHLELVEAERAIFGEHDEVIIISDKKVQDRDEGGEEEKAFDVEE
ncbi:Endoglucanase 6 [Hordeum vulgare]|nr:Endoglucanase 6 [Hordeum vulgare]